MTYEEAIKFANGENHISVISKSGVVYCVSMDQVDPRLDTYVYGFRVSKRTTRRRRTQGETRWFNLKNMKPYTRKTIN